LERNRWRGLAGDTIKAILSAAAMNCGQLLRFFLGLFAPPLGRAFSAPPFAPHRVNRVFQDRLT
jgi:hypothetical protein